MRNKNAAVLDPNKFFTCAGSKYHIDYEPKVLPDGSIHLEPSGKMDINEMINSFANTCDMQYILKQLALGNTDVLAKDPGMYGDFTEMPKTYAEALQLQIDSEKAFYQLPLETRNAFDNDFRKWFASAGSEEWIQKMTPPAAEAEAEPAPVADPDQK